MAVLHIHLLGDFSLSLDDTPSTTVMVPRVQSLLIYLLLHRAAPQSRSHLAFLLWPDSTETQAHTNLRQLLYHLRQALPTAKQFLSIGKHSVQWLATDTNSTFTLDVLEFEQLLTQAEQAEQIQDRATTQHTLEQAVHIYRGDLLPSCYEEWIVPERDRLRQLFLQAAERLLALQEEERTYSAAITTARQILRQDPLHEAIYRQLMRLHDLQDNRAAALRTYHTCVTTLERELGTGPSKATQTVYESLLKSDTSLATPAEPLTKRSTAPPLVGRKTEWRQLQEAWHKAVDGQPCMVILTGEAGIGKTRLAEEMEAWVKRLGMPRANARCYANLGHMAYAPITSWLRADALQADIATLDSPWLTEISRLLPEVLTRQPALPHPSSMTEGWQQHYFFEALAHALLSVRRPLLLLLDDLQWCDHETLQWLQYLFHFAPQAPLLLIGTIRIGEMTPSHPLVASLNALQREHLAIEIALGPLTSTETASLAEHVVGQPFNPVIAQSLYTETEGNPLFIVEMVRTDILEQHQRKQVATGQVPLLLTSSTSTLPPAVQAVLMTRLAQLSPLAHEVAAVGAVIGREFAFSVLAQASEREEDEVVRGLDELWQKRIIREQDTEMAQAYDFSHDKLREQVYTSLSPASRRRLHRRVAEAFKNIYAEDLNTISGQIAVHYERAGLPRQAIAHYQQAGEVAKNIYANTEAKRLFERAVALIKAHPPGQVTSETIVQIYEALGDVTEEIGCYDEARQIYLHALTHSIPVQEHIWRARLQRKIANTWSHATPNFYDTLRINARKAFQEAEQILTQAADPTNPTWREEWIELHFAQIWPMNWSTDDLTAAIEKVQPIVKQYGSKEQQDFLFQAKATRNLVRNRYVTSNSEERQRFWQTTLAVIERSGNKGKLGVHYLAHGIDLWCADAFDEAEEQLNSAMRVGEQTGIARLQARGLMFLSFTIRRRGQVEQLQNLLIHAQQIGIAWENSVLTGHRAWLAWREGDMAAAERYSRAALVNQPLENNPFQWVGRWPLVGIALAHNRYTDAMDEVRMLLDPTQQMLPETLNAALVAALQAWDIGLQKEACALLRQAALLAREKGYL